MTNYEWDAHKAKWCERCKHNTRRGGGVSCVRYHGAHAR